MYATRILGVLCVVHVIVALPKKAEPPNYPSRRGFQPKSPTPFRQPEEDDDDTYPEETQQRAGGFAENPYLYQNVIPVKQKVQQIQTRPGKGAPPQYRNQQPLGDKTSKELEEEEIEEPDRLSVLLPQTKFECNNKNTGYYADEELGCEVFHYCQDNARHSWICPEGFTFHQVHLICMPPGGDNICEKSSKFHFVNEYLYKPVNLEEYQQKPNVSLRYHERYYPQNYYEDRESEQQQEDRPQIQHRHSVRVQQEEPIHRATFRPETRLGQVFRSPNEVNIPLQQRRPQYAPQGFFENK